MTSLPEGSVIITPNEMYKEMQEIGRKVDHLTSVVDPSLLHIQAAIADNKNSIAVIKAEREVAVAGLDLRITALEHWRWFVLGVAAIVAALIPTLITMILNGVF